MVQVIKLCGRSSILAAAGALLLAATPALAGGHMGGHGFRAAPMGRMVGRPAIAVRPGVGSALRPGFVARPALGFNRPLAGRGFYAHRPGFYGTYGRFGYDFGYAYPRPVYGRAWGGGWGAALPGADFGWGMAAPIVVAAYPDGFGGASDTPTGNGVIYNVPPPAWAPAKIITIKGNRAQSAHYIRPRQVIVVRGSASVD